MAMEKRVVVRCLAGFGAAATMAFAAGCGSETAPVGPSGQVVQGPVSGAKVFADKKLAGGAFGNFVVDAEEAATQTTTNAQGSYTLPVAPGYEYLVVSQGGTDTITGVEAMQLLAPAGARNVTPLTTIVALQPDVKAKIEALGVKFDDNIATTATPAALLLVKSIETVVAALTETLNSGNNLSDAQVNDIQAKAVASIAAKLAEQATSDTAFINAVTNAATLQNTMVTALTSALQTIDATSSNITVANAAAIANSCAGTVATVANAISPTGSFTVTGSASEAAIFTTSVVNQIVNQVNTVVTSNTGNVTVTPTPTTPPATGSTGGTGGSGIGGNF